MAKFRVGDEVTVRAVIAAELHDGRVFLAFPESEGAPPGTMVNATLTAASIATHTPKPREFKPGDMVTWGIGTMPAEFIAERDGFAIMWVPRHRTVEREPISTLRYAGEKDGSD